jgi:hypothetical protein
VCTRKAWTLELLAFHEHCSFYTPALFTLQNKVRIKVKASLALFRKTNQNYQNCDIHAWCAPGGNPNVLVSMMPKVTNPISYLTGDLWVYVIFQRCELGNLYHTIFQICTGDSAHTTDHTSPGMTHCY